MRSPLTEPLQDVARAWRAATGSSRRRFALVGFALVAVAAMFVARQGTGRTRVGAALLLGAGAVAAIGWRTVEVRRLRDPASIAGRLVRRVDRERADRLLRALTLPVADGQPRRDGTSEELARLHLARVMAQVPADRVVAGGVRSAVVLGRLSLVGLVALLAVVAARGWSVLEGADVLVARGGVAPVTMRWLDDIDLSARPPEYLQSAERSGFTPASLSLPYGTTITVRGVPSRPGRRLLLGDGATEVPFVEDGAGALVARWELTATASLCILARFGDVAIPQADPVFVESIPDLAPEVRLEGAPRQVVLADQSEPDIALAFEATDDHGLREVHLVLRSGTREERRVLARLDGTTRLDRGGYTLRFRDPFVRQSHAPVEITVEAEDNDPLTGPKWGASQAIVLVPPSVGEPEARRLDALRGLRDALVDALAWRLAAGPRGPGAIRSYVAESKRRGAELDALVDRTLSDKYAGVRVAPRTRAMIVAQQQSADKAAAAEERAPSPDAHVQAAKASEHFVLVVDAIVRGLGIRDARAAAVDLADVADDLSLGAAQARGEGAPAASAPAASAQAAGPRTDPKGRGTLRMDAATAVLAGGAQALARLGMLGRDLGEIIGADLGRVARARDASDLVHAELAARDLAVRLHQPDPSFGARGGRSARAEGASEGGKGADGDEAKSPDEVERAFQESARDLEQLAQDHAGATSKVERTIAEATSEQERLDLREEAKRHAKAIRDATRELPSVGSGSDSWTSKGAAARELAEQMARALEGAQTEDAVQSGRSAIGSLEEAKRILDNGGWMQDPGGREQRLVEDARRKLAAEEQWAEQASEQLRKRAAERARAQLEQSGLEEGELAERARQLAKQGRDQGSLPEEAIESISDAEQEARKAADALHRGDVKDAMERQRGAQRHLEAASSQLHDNDDDDSGDSQGSPGQETPGDHGRAPGHAPVPGRESHKGPEEFRRRVLRGLDQPSSGALKDAVRRYAEGLMR